MDAKSLDLSQAIVVTPKNLTGFEEKAVSVLIEEIAKRTGISLRQQPIWSEENVPVIAVGPAASLKGFAGPYFEVLQKESMPGAEGYRITVWAEPYPAAVIVGSDARGVLYGVGRLLRKLSLGSNRIAVRSDLNIATAPRYPLRGHQLGYRPKNNACDAWSPAQFDQYIRELAIFGTNSIEILPPRTDDDFTGPHMKVSPREMMVELSRIIDSYGLDVWIWYPNIGNDYTHPDSIRTELAEREEIFRKLPRIDAVFVPGGDPGDLHPDDLFPWLEKVARTLQKYHPSAKIWVSPQAFRPTRYWLDSFYAHVNKRPPWLGGVVFAPWVKTPLPEMRRILSSEIPIRRYPDITHTFSCQYPVPEWDLAFAMTLGRECINPRPVAEKHIHNALDEYAIGSISYSEGINDDVNKFVWSDQDWNPETPVVETLRDYSRFFIGEEYTEDFTQGLIALEKNWVGPPAASSRVQVTLQQWLAMERSVRPEVLGNYRFQMGLLRAYYDAYIQRRVIYETALQGLAMDALRDVPINGALAALDEAKRILKLARTEPVARDYRRRCEELADDLFEAIGAQLTVKKHGAISRGRGAFMDGIDEPLNDIRWLLAQFKTIRKMRDEAGRLAAIRDITERTNPGPGGFYDNFGTPASWHRVSPGEGWERDPGGLASTRVSFGVGIQGVEWLHTAQDTRVEEIAPPLAWMTQATTLYDTPLIITYDYLDPAATYVLKVSYTGRFRSRMRLVANGEYEIHDFIQIGVTPIMTFEVPQQAIADGRLELTWTCGEGERGSQVSEVWLIRKSWGDVPASPIKSEIERR